MEGATVTQSLADAITMEEFKTQTKRSFYPGHHIPKALPQAVANSLWK
jgi:hypothetical protein